MGPIVTAATAAALPRDAILVQVEAGDVASAAATFAEGHLPGARLLMRDRVTARPMEPGDGRHPLPTPEVFATELGAMGIGPDDAVVAYDREGGASAARLVYLLRVLGRSLCDVGGAGFLEQLLRAVVQLDAVDPAQLAQEVERDRVLAALEPPRRGLVEFLGAAQLRQLRVRKPLLRSLPIPLDSLCIILCNALTV